MRFSLGHKRQEWDFLFFPARGNWLSGYSTKPTKQCPKTPEVNLLSPGQTHSQRDEPSRSLVVA